MKAGRKRAFDKEVALDAAMRVFWNNGYAGTSITQLSSVLGINAPSLYSAFGNKENLFRDVLSHYFNQYAASSYLHLTEDNQASFEVRLTSYFGSLINLFTSEETPKGCLLVKSVNEAGSVAFPEAVSGFLQQQGAEIQDLMVAFIESNLSINNTDNGEQSAIIVNYISTVSHGIAVQARAGQSVQSLHSVAEFTVQSLLVRVS